MTKVIYLIAIQDEFWYDGFCSFVNILFMGSAPGVVMNINSLQKFLGEDASYFNIEVFDVIDSTNTYLKTRASEYLSAHGTEKNAPWYVAIANRQSAGRGRMGRTFASPGNSGIYMSVLFRPDLPAEQAVCMTTAAAVAACRAIEECTDKKPRIKWVNDVFVDGKKACGILTEASVNPENGGFDWAVLGIGFNVYPPEEGFPKEIRDIAGAITEVRSPELRDRISAAFLKELYRVCLNLKTPDFIEEYKSRCFLIGEKIDVLRDGKGIPAFAYGLDDDLHLLVRYEDGSEEALNSGEVSTSLHHNV